LQCGGDDDELGGAQQSEKPAFALPTEAKELGQLGFCAWLLLPLTVDAVMGKTVMW
jgi:hypothetical protein